MDFRRFRTKYVSWELEIQEEMDYRESELEIQNENTEEWKEAPIMYETLKEI